MKNLKSKTIVHVFNGWFYYLDKTMIHRFFSECPDWNHIFVIFVPTVAILEDLNRFFDEKQIPPESIFYIRSIGFGNNGSRSAAAKKVVEFLDAVRIYWILFFRYRRSPLVFHGTTFALGYLFLNFFDCRKIMWVCWSIPRNLYSRRNVRNFMKKRVFHRLGIIDTLMTADYQVLSTEVKLGNAVLCSYISSKQPDVVPKHFEHRILIGNNDVFVAEYQKDVKLLVDHLSPASKAAITVGTMLNYGRASDSDKEILRQSASSFGQYIEWTEVLPYDEYCRHMATYDIYICSHPTQSGIGAALTMLRYGKKCFLAGYNLAWFRELGFVVFDFLDSIKNHPEEFETPLADVAIRQNILCYENHYSAGKIAAKWDALFAELAAEKMQ